MPMRPALLFTLAFTVPVSALVFEDRFESDARWDLLDMKGNGEVEFVENVNAPPGYGSAVLHLDGEHVIGLAKGIRLGDGTVVVLYRELQPRDRDADGVVLFRAQYPDDVSAEHNTKQVRRHVWLELDNDSGMHFTHVDDKGREKTPAELPGVGLVTDPWNKTGWIWQKVRMKGDRFRAKFWPAERAEPAEWPLEMDFKGPETGRIGFRLGSGDVELAYFAADTADIPIGPPCLYLFSAQECVTQLKRLDLTLFANLERGDEYTFDIVAHGSGEPDRARFPLPFPAGHSATPILLTAEGPPEGFKGPVVRLAQEAAPGTLLVTLTTTGEDGESLGAQYTFVVLPVGQVRALFDQVLGVLEALGGTLEETEAENRRSVSLHIIQDAARAHCDHAWGLFEQGDVNAAQRSLRFAIEALHELDGYKGQWLRDLAPDAKLPELPDSPLPPEEYEPGEDGIVDVYSPDYLIRFGTPEIRAQSFVMGRSYEVVLPWTVEGASPDRDFAFEVRLESPLGHRVVASSKTAPEKPTSKWKPGKVYRQRLKLDIVAEDARRQPSAPLVLDEYHLLLVSVSDPATGGRLVLDNTPTPRNGRPNAAYLAGEFYVSSTPLEIHGFTPADSRVLRPRRDGAVVLNVGEVSIDVQALFVARTETDRVVFRDLLPLTLEVGARKAVEFRWTPDTAGQYQISFELLRDGVTLTQAGKSTQVALPEGYDVRVVKANHVANDGHGRFVTPITIEVRGGGMPIQARVYAEGRLVGSATSATPPVEVKAEPWLGYYDVEVDVGEFRYAERLVATVSEVRDGQLLVNGEPFIVKGINVHGMDARSPARTRTMMQLMRDLGFNAWRGDYPGRWQVDLAFEMNTVYSPLAQFSCIDTEKIFARQDGPPLVTARALAQLFAERYKDSAGVLLWNSCNEIGGETTDFVLSLYPIFKHLDAYQRPVHYANLYGQDRWQGQDVVGVNYYFGFGQTAQDRQPLIQRSIDIAHDHGLPTIYTEYNSFLGSIHTTGADAVRNMFAWGVEQGMNGGFFYTRFNSERHPCVFDPDYNTHRILNDALTEAFADARVELLAAEGDALRLRVCNKRDFALRQVRLRAAVNEQEVSPMTLDEFAPRDERNITVSIPADDQGPPYVVTGMLEFVTHFGFRNRVPFRLVSN